MGFHAFHEPDSPPSQIRQCVAGFMTRFAPTSVEHLLALVVDRSIHTPSTRRARSSASLSSPIASAGGTGACGIVHAAATGHILKLLV
jgi:hypothetical protein